MAIKIWTTNRINLALFGLENLGFSCQHQVGLYFELSLYIFGLNIYYCNFSVYSIIVWFTRSTNKLWACNKLLWKIKNKLCILIPKETSCLLYTFPPSVKMFWNRDHLLLLVVLTHFAWIALVKKLPDGLYQV